jgi:DNA-binding NarL/FixJ family response regulator
MDAYREQFREKEIVVIQHWANGHPPDAIAKKMGVSISTVQAYQTRIRKFMRVYEIAGESDVERCCNWLVDAGVNRA